MPDAVSAAEVAALLADIGSVSPYFAVQAEPGADWSPLAELIDDGAAARERVGVARAFLTARLGNEVEQRACASINFLGVASRLVSPALAAACLGRVVPVLRSADMWWQRVEGGPIPLAVVDPLGVPVSDAAAAADAMAVHVLAPVVLPLLARYRAEFAVSPQVLSGNIASALAGAATMLLTCGRPLLLDPVDVVEELLARGPLRDAGRYVRPDGDRRFFVRHNCCLFYRVPAAGKCGDCVLVPEAARLDLWLQADQAGTGSG